MQVSGNQCKTVEDCGKLWKTVQNCGKLSKAIQESAIRSNGSDLSVRTARRRSLLLHKCKTLCKYLCKMYTLHFANICAKQYTLQITAQFNLEKAVQCQTLKGKSLLWLDHLNYSYLNERGGVWCCWCCFVMRTIIMILWYHWHYWWWLYCGIIDIDGDHSAIICICPRSWYLSLSLIKFTHALVSVDLCVSFVLLIKFTRNLISPQSNLRDCIV